MKFLHQRAVLPLHPDRKGGVLTSKSRREMLFLSLALLVPHVKGLSFSISASGHKQMHKQLNERFSICFQREMERDSSAIHSTSGIPKRSRQSGELWGWGSDKDVPGSLLQTEMFHDCGEGTGGLICCQINATT